MKKQPAASRTPPLATGQLWQLKDSYVQIARVGKTLAEYKMLRKPGQRAVKSRLGSVASVASFLKTNKAKLILLPSEEASAAP
jgi:hypothetical protein